MGKPVKNHIFLNSSKLSITMDFPFVFSGDLYPGTYLYTSKDNAVPKVEVKSWIYDEDNPERIIKATINDAWNMLDVFSFTSTGSSSKTLCFNVPKTGKISIVSRWGAKLIIYSPIDSQEFAFNSSSGLGAEYNRIHGNSMIIGMYPLSNFSSEQHKIILKTILSNWLNNNIGNNDVHVNSILKLVSEDAPPLIIFDRNERILTTDIETINERVNMIDLSKNFWWPVKEEDLIPILEHSDPPKFSLSIGFADIQTINRDNDDWIYFSPTRMIRNIFKDTSINNDSALPIIAWQPPGASIADLNGKIQKIKHGQFVFYCPHQTKTDSAPELRISKRVLYLNNIDSIEASSSFDGNWVCRNLNSLPDSLTPFNSLEKNTNIVISKEKIIGPLFHFMNPYYQIVLPNEDLIIQILFNLSKITKQELTSYAKSIYNEAIIYRLEDRLSIAIEKVYAGLRLNVFTSTDKTISLAQQINALNNSNLFLILCLAIRESGPLILDYSIKPQDVGFTSQNSLIRGDDIHTYWHSGLDHLGRYSPDIKNYTSRRTITNEHEYKYYDRGWVYTSNRFIESNIEEFIRNIDTHKFAGPTFDLISRDNDLLDRTENNDPIEAVWINDPKERLIVFGGYVNFRFSGLTQNVPESYTLHDAVLKSKFSWEYDVPNLSNLAKRIWNAIFFTRPLAGSLMVMYLSENGHNLEDIKKYGEIGGPDYKNTSWMRIAISFAICAEALAKIMKEKYRLELN